MKIWTQQEEAERLAARFSTVNRAAFARDHKIKGGQAIIYQHLKGLRPISRDAALAYAKGFNVKLEEISPRLAKEAAAAIAQSGESSETTLPANIVQEDRIPYTVPSMDPNIRAVVQLMSETDAEGRIRARFAVEDTLASYRHLSQRAANDGTHLQNDDIVKIITSNDNQDLRSAVLAAIKAIGINIDDIPSQLKVKK